MRKKLEERPCQALEKENSFVAIFMYQGMKWERKSLFANIHTAYSKISAELTKNNG